MLASAHQGVARGLPKFDQRTNQQTNPIRRQRLTYIRDLRPIKRDQTHPQPLNISKQLVHDDIFRRDPAHPGKVGERLEEISRDKVPDHAGRPYIKEEPFARDSSLRTHTSIGFRVKRIE